MSEGSSRALARFREQREAAGAAPADSDDSGGSSSSGDEEDAREVELADLARRQEAEREAEERDEAQKRDKDFQRQFLDNMLEEYYAEKVELGEKQPLNEVSGNVELQRLMAALRFLVEDADLRGTLLRDAGMASEVLEARARAAASHTGMSGAARKQRGSDSDDTDSDSDAAAAAAAAEVDIETVTLVQGVHTPGSLAAATSQTATVQIGAERQKERREREREKRRLAAMAAAQKKAAKKAAAEGGGAAATAAGYSAGGGAKRTTRRVRRKPAAEASEADEKASQDGEGAGAGAAAAEPDVPLAPVPESAAAGYHNLVSNAKESRADTAFGADFQRYVGEGLAEAELERFSHIWADFDMDEDFPVVTDFERQCFARLTEYLSERCQEQREVLELEMAGDGAFKQFDHDDVMAALQDQFHWRLQNMLADLRRVETAPQSYHTGGFLFRVDNLLAVLMYRRRFADALASEQQARDDEEHARLAKRAVEADRVRFMGRLLSVFRSDGRRLAWMLGALLGFLVVASVVVITVTGMTEVDDNMTRGIFFLNQENEARARTFVQDTLSQPPAAMEMHFAAAPVLLAEPDSIVNGLDSAPAAGNDPTGVFDRHLTALVRQFKGVRGAFVTDSLGGHFIGAYRTDVSGPRYGPGDADVRIVATGVDALGDSNGFLSLYGVSANGTREGAGQSVSLPASTPTYRPADQVWAGVTGPSGPLWSSVHLSPVLNGVQEVDTAADGVERPFAGVISYAAAFTAIDDGSQLGVFGIEVSTSDLGSMLADIAVWGDGVAYVCDADWSVVATSGGQVSLDSDDLAALPHEVRATAGLFRSRFGAEAADGDAAFADVLDNADSLYASDVDGVEFSVALAFQPGVASSHVSAPDLDPDGAGGLAQWKLVVAVERDELFGTVDTNLLFSYALGCTAMALAAALTFFSHRMVEAQEAPRAKKRKRGPGARGPPALMRVNSGRFVDAAKLKQAKAGAAFCFVAVICVLLLIWALWSRSAARSTGEITTDLESEAAEHVMQEARRAMATPARAMRLVQDALEAGGPWDRGTPAEGSDRYFSHLVSGLWAGGLTQYTTAVRVARPDGSLIGAKVVRDWAAAGGTGTNYGVRLTSTGGVFDTADASDWGLFVTVREADSDPAACYREYVSAPGDDLGNNVSALVRDTGVAAARESAGCLYDPREEDWYTAAQAAALGEVVFTRAHRLPFEDEVGVSFSARVADAAGDEVVVSADVTMAHVSELLLRPIREGDGGSRTLENSPRTVLIQRSGELVASSELSDQERVEEIGPFLGTQSTDAGTASTVRYLINRVDKEGNSLGLDTLSGDQKIFRVLDDPITTVGVLDSCCDADNLIVVVDLPFEAFFEEFDRVLLLATMLCFGTFLLTAYLLSSSLIAFRDKVLNKNEFRNFEREQQKLLSILGGDTVSRKTLVRLMHDVRRPVVTACAHSWRRRVARRDERLAPVQFDALRTHYANTAIKHIHSSRNGRNVLLFCELQSRGQDLSEEYNPARDDPWPFRIYRWFTSVKYRLLLHAVIFFHIGLFFVEPDTYDDLRRDGANRFVLFAEFVCLCVELLDLIAKLLITYRFDTHTVPFTDVSVRADITYVVVLALVALDFCLTLFFDFSFEYLFPLRPLILLLRNDHVRGTAYQFLKTLYYARDVFLLYLCIVLTAAAMGTILFRTVITTDGPESSFENYIRALVTSFVYISTGENFTELVYPAWDQSGLYMFYFFSFMFVGMFVVLAMVIGVFSNGFQSQRKAKERQQQIFSRLGAVSAFVLLDMDGNESLSRHEFKGFLDHLRPNLNRHAMDALFRSINKDDDEDLDVTEFVQGVEEIVWHRLIIQNEIVHHSKPRLFFRFFVFEQEWFQKVVVVVTLMNIWLLSLYGTLERERLLDALGAAFILFMAAEMALRIFAYGFDEFWNYARYNGPKNRGDPLKVLRSHGVYDSGESRLSAASMESEDAEAAGGGGGGGGRPDAFGRDAGDAREDKQTEHGFLLNGLTTGDRAAEKERLRERQSTLAEALDRAARQKAAVAAGASNAAAAEAAAGGKQDDRAEYELAGDTTQVLREQQPVFGPNAENVNQMYANRFDLCLIVFSTLAFIASRVYVESFTFSEDEDAVRFVMTFPALRIFSVVRRTRLLVFTLLKLVPRIASIVAVMIVVFFLYAVVGVWMFSDRWSDLQDRATPGNFNNITEAMLTLFQMLVGEGWHLIMYAAVRATRGFGTSWYFISFIVVVTLLFVNTLIAVILDAFHQVFEAQQEERVRVQRERLDKLQEWKRQVARGPLAMPVSSSSATVRFV